MFGQCVSYTRFFIDGASPIRLHAGYIILGLFVVPVVCSVFHGKVYLPIAVTTFMM